jgi:hypothetical protein
MTLLLFFILTDAPAQKDKPTRKERVEAARTVVAAVVEAARANAKLDTPTKGDALTEAYVKAAALAAKKLPQDRSAWAFAMGLGVALDRSTMLRTNLLTRSTWREIETDAERKKRLEVLGEPTTHGRFDLTQHFWISAALTALWGPKQAEAAGVLKEWMDSADGGSGFSFADLAADLGGVELASRVIDRPALLAGLTKGFAVKDHCPAPKGLEEGIKRKDFEKRFGSTEDERFVKELEALKKKVTALPAYREKK